jgi:hypothetical protein
LASTMAWRNNGTGVAAPRVMIRASPSRSTLPWMVSGLAGVRAGKGVGLADGRGLGRGVGFGAGAATSRRDAVGCGGGAVVGAAVGRKPAHPPSSKASGAARRLLHDMRPSLSCGA